MPRDINGNFSLDPSNPVIPGSVIETGWANPTLQDIAAALTDSLSRSGSGGMLAPFRFADGTLAAPGIAFTNEPSSGLYRAALNDIRFAIGSSDVLRFIPSGVVIPAGKTLTGGLTITGGSINGTPIGNTTPSTGAFTSVVTPQLTTSGAVNLGLGVNGATHFVIDNSNNLYPSTDNVKNFGIPTNRIANGYFGTSVVTPLIGTDTATVVSFKYNGATVLQYNNVAVNPAVDNAVALGSSGNRFASVCTPVIDSGTSAPLTISLNNGVVAHRFETNINAVNFLASIPNPTGTAPVLTSHRSADANTGLTFGTKGTGTFSFNTNADGTPATELQILHTANATKCLVLTGAGAAGNPSIGATGGANVQFNSPILPIAGLFPAFESAEQGIPVGNTVLSVAHGLGRTPKLMVTVLRCKTAELGYAVGDEVTIYSAGVNPMVSTWASSTTCKYVCSSSTLQITDAVGATGVQPITAARWRVVFYAW